MKECTNEVCGMRRVGGKRRMGSEWWSEEVGVAAAEKRRKFEQWLQFETRWNSYGRYRAPRAVLKQAVNITKTIVDWRWSERLGKDNGENNIFWNDIKRAGIEG